MQWAPWTRRSESVAASSRIKLDFINHFKEALCDEILEFILCGLSAKHSTERLERQGFQKSTKNEEY